MNQETGVPNSGAESTKAYNSYLQSPEDVQAYESYAGKPQVPEQAVVAQPQVSPPPQVSDVERNLSAMRDEMARQRRENEELRYNLDLWRTQLAKQNQEPPAIQQLGKDDPMTRGVYEDDMSSKFQKLEQQIQDLNFKLSENSVASRYSDYDEVVNTYTVPLVNQKPHLADSIRNATNKPAVAYEIGRLQREAEMARQELQKAKAQYSYQAAPQSSPQLRMLENAMKPGSLSMVGGEGTFVPQMKKNYATMSDAEFEAEYRANSSY